jgi:hypothetical protein
MKWVIKRPTAIDCNVLQREVLVRERHVLEEPRRKGIQKAGC